MNTATKQEILSGKYSYDELFELNQSLKKKNTMLAKTIRESNRKIIVCDLWFSLASYGHYWSIKLDEKCLKQENPTYTDAEDVAELCEMLLGREFKPHHFLHSESELQQSLLDNYTQYQNSLNDFEKTRYTPKRVADAFCKALHHSHREVIEGNHLNIKNHLAHIYQYLFNKITKEQLIKSLINVNPYTGEKQGFNAKEFRQKLRNLVDLYTEIKTKQELRNK